MEACTLKAHVKDKNGNIVESQLYNGLSKYLDSKREANRYYSLSQKDQFRTEFSDRLEFDTLGEPTLSSFIEAAGIKLNDRTTIKKIEKEVQTGSFNYDLAVQKIFAFNTQHPLKDKYLATLEIEEDGNYKVSIVQKNLEEMHNLTKTLEDYQLANRINTLLKEKLGVGVLFNVQAPFRGRYSTKDASKGASGLHYLVQIASGNFFISEVLAEEAGHVIIGSLGDSQLVTRLQSLLKDSEVQKALLGEEFNTKELGKNPAREIAGDLVGKALINKLTESQKKHSSYGLIKRIIAYAKQIFSKLSPDIVTKQIEEAKLTAEMIAEGFMSSEFAGDISNNLKTEETLYSADKVEGLDPLVKGYIDSVAALKKMYNSFSAYKIKDPKDNDKRFSEAKIMAPLTANTAQLMSLTDKDEQRIFATEYLKQVLDLAIILGEEIINAKDNQKAALSSQNTVLSDAAERDVFRLIHKYIIVNDAVSFIESTLSKFSVFREGTVNIYNEDGTLTPVDLTRPLKALRETLDQSTSQLNTWSRQWFLRFLEKIYGKTYIEKCAKVVFASGHPKSENQTERSKNIANQSKQAEREKSITYTITHPSAWSKKFRLYRDEAHRVTLDALLAGEEFTDINLYAAWLSPMSDCGDPIQSIIKIAFDKANREKLRQTEADRVELNSLFSELGRTTHNLNTARFFKRVDGKINGYLLARFDYGKWEKARKEREKEWTEKFLGDLLENYGGNQDAVDAYRYADPVGYASLLGAYMEQGMKDWHKKNSFYDKELGRYIPNLGSEDGKVDYSDPDYYNLSSAEKAWLEKYFAWKGNKEKQLKGQAVVWRAPQTKGTLKCIAQNNIEGTTLKKWSKALQQEYYHKTEINEEDKYATGYENQNDETEDLLYDSNVNMVQDISRIPILGIRLRKNLDQLNTDLLSSSYEYSFMLNNAISLENVLHAANVGARVLKERDKNFHRDPNSQSKAFAAYLRNINRLLYNKIPSSFFGKSVSYKSLVVANKIMNTLKALGTQIALGWNPNPAIVNVGTGFLEIEKEARAGEWFNMQDFLEAQKLYASSRASNLKSTMTGDVFLEEDGDIGRMLLYFDAQNNYSERIAKARKDKVMRVLSSPGFALYTLGDNFMQGVPFLSMAIHQKLYDTKENKWVNLTNIYKTTYKTNSLGKKEIADFGFEEGRYSFFEDSKRVHEKLSIMLQDLDGIYQADTLTEGWEDYYNKHWTDLRPILIEVGKIEERDTMQAAPRNIEYLTQVLNEAKDKLYWNLDHEDRFVSKARNVCNRLHGIYSNIDKVNAAGSSYGAASLSMKGYALGMIERRFSSNYFNAVLDKDVEGSYWTFIKMCVDPEISNFDKYPAILALSPWMPNGFREKLKNAGYSDNQIANISRTRSDIWTGTTFAILYNILAKMIEAQVLAAKLSADNDDNDEDDIFWDNVHYSRWLGFGAFLAYKLRNEQIAWWMPGNLYAEVAGLWNLMPVGVSTTYQLLDRTADLLKYGYHYYYDREWFKRPDPELFELDSPEGQLAYEQAAKESQSRCRKLFGSSVDFVTAEEEGDNTRPDGTPADRGFIKSKIFKKWNRSVPWLPRVIGKMEDYRDNISNDQFSYTSRKH